MMMFSSFVFEEYFPFSIKYKRKVIQEQQETDEIDSDEKEFVDLSLLLHKELRIRNEEIKQKKTLLKTSENSDKSKLKEFEKYFYFLFRIFLKKNLKNSSSFRIDDLVYKEAKKVLKMIFKGTNEINYKSVSSTIRKNFEFAVLDSYYEKQNLLQ